jgi:hypothetical protein
MTSVTGLIPNSEFERTWIDQGLWWRLPEGTEENHENPHSGYPVPGHIGDIDREGGNRSCLMRKFFVQKFLDWDTFGCSAQEALTILESIAEKRVYEDANSLGLAQDIIQ